MKTLDEMYPSGRGDRRRFTSEHLASTIWYEPIFRNGNDWHGIWNDGRLMTVDGGVAMVEWYPPKRKVTMYRPIQKSCDGYFAIDSAWMSDKKQFDSLDAVVGWEEKEVEVTG